MNKGMFGLTVGLAASAILGFASPVFAEKCKYGDHERDEGDTELKCKKCEEIANNITVIDPNVWTLKLKHGHPKRVQIKPETGNPEVFWYVYYEISNTDKIARPCFIDVMAETDKGKNTFTYHDSNVPEVKDELRRVLGLKESEVLWTSDELCSPPADAANPGKKVENSLPKQDGAIKVARDTDKNHITPKPGEPPGEDWLLGRVMLPKDGEKLDGHYKGGCASLAVPMLEPGETRKCVAIFRKFDTEFDVLTIFFHGLTNQVLGLTPAPIQQGREEKDSLNPESTAIADGEYRLVHDDLKPPADFRRKVVERIFAVEYSCLGDEFAKSTRSIKVNEEQTLRPKNLARYPETDPARYHDVGIFGVEIIEAEDKSVEGKKPVPYTFVGRKWIQTERIIKSDLK